MGLFPSIKRWLTLPLHPNRDIVSLTLYIGLLFLIAWLWNTVIQGIGRIESSVRIGGEGE